VRQTSSRWLPASLPAAAAMFLCVAGLRPAAPARADWLVTRDGGRVETQGPWKVDGKRVVFTLKDGSLSSLRLTEVDLDASRQATTAMAEEEAAAAAKASAATEAAPVKKSSRVFTDKDFVRPAAAPKDDARDAGDAKPAPDSTTTPGAVKVVDWKQSHNQDTHALEITGSVRNTGPDLAVAISVNVRLFNPRGEQFATQSASLSTRSLHPGQNTAFTAVFPDVIDFASAKIDVLSTPLLQKAPPPADENAETPPPK
jgi:hypothetical protein